MTRETKMGADHALCYACERPMPETLCDACNPAVLFLEAQDAALLAALERILNRAERIISGEIECTAWSAADYDAQVARSAIAAAKGEEG